METNFEATCKAALALPKSERELLVELLLETLPPDIGELSDDELLAEIERRWQEFEKTLRAASLGQRFGMRNLNKASSGEISCASSSPAAPGWSAAA
jgi:putative addiction module component (TIGR02574 family)